MNNSVIDLTTETRESLWFVYVFKKILKNNIVIVVKILKNKNSLLLKIYKYL
jgi:hypothetical protein